MQAKKIPLLVDICVLALFPWKSSNQEMKPKCHPEMEQYCPVSPLRYFRRSELKHQPQRIVVSHPSHTHTFTHTQTHTHPQAHTIFPWINAWAFIYWRWFVTRRWSGDIVKSWPAFRQSSSSLWLRMASWGGTSEDGHKEMSVIHAHHTIIIRCKSFAFSTTQS